MKTLHIVSHTHWDREWYLTFQQFRFRLVGLIDRLLDLLERDPVYRTFTLDGQTIVLDDYLEIRPEQEARIRQLVQEGRLQVGPWYILPDEFLEGPEALIRNLLLGRRGCRRFTAEPQPMERIGYIPDPFGHISQLPQIAAGFGLDALCFWRGVGDAPTEFRWAAPDGSECLVLHLRNSYSNGAWLAADEAGFIRDLAAERDALAPQAPTSHLLVMQGTDHMEPRADLSARLRAAASATALAGDRLVHSSLPAYLAAVRAELGDEGLAALPLLRGEMRSPQRAHLLPGVLSTRIWIKQRNAHCEALLTRWAEPFSALAEGIAGDAGQRGLLRQAWTWLLQNHPHDSICGCSVDQVHREMQARFAWSEQIAELVTQASLEALARQIETAGARYAGEGQETACILVFNPTPFPRTDRVRVRLKPAPIGDWRLVDSSDQEVPCRLLGHPIREQFNAAMDRQTLAGWLAKIAADRGHVSGGLFLHRVETRLPGTTSGLRPETASGLCAHLTVTVAYGPASTPEAELEQIQSLLADETIEGFHVLVIEDDGLDLEFLARDVPGLGYTQFAVTRPGTAPGPRPGTVPGLGVQRRHAIEPSPVGAGEQVQYEIENEFFRVEANPNDGTLTVTDKASGLVLPGVNRFVDGGDRGDEYTYCPPERDLLVDAPATPPTIRRVDDGLGSSLEISALYRLPRSLADGDRSVRSAELVDVPITSRVRLTPGVRRVEFETRVDNRAADHRLRVHFPTPIVTDRSWAEGHFDLVERTVGGKTDSPLDGWAEQPVGTHPQLTFVDVSDSSGKHGVLLANRGLPEYEILPGTEEALPVRLRDCAGVTLALTLLRCVGWLSRTDLHNRDGHAGPALPTPEAQCPGEHTFHYALVPHTGNYLTAYREAHAFNTALRAVCSDAHKGPLPANGSLLEISPAAVVLSAIKAAEEGEGLVVRFYNAAPLPVQARLRLWRRFAQAALIPLGEGGPIRCLAENTDAVTLPLRAKEIATLHFQFGP